MGRLSVCDSCGRHAREREVACPFCGGVLRDATAETRATPRVSRAVLIAGVGAAAVGVACGTTHVSFYGAPFDASGVDDTSNFDAIPFYGSPPLDSGATDAPNDTSDAGDADDASDGD